MGMKASIYIDDETIEAVKARMKPGESMGGVYRDAAKRGLTVLALEIRALANLFTEPEWQVILDSMKGALTDPSLIAVNVEDNINLNDAGKRRGLTGQQERDLIARIDDLSPGAKWAILDVANRFLSSDLEANANGLKKLGVVCRGE